MSELNKVMLNGIEYDIGGSNGGNIPSENITSSTDTEDIDLFANAEWTSGIYINAKGQESSNANYLLSEPFSITSETPVTFLSKKPNGNFCLCCYDSTGAWVGKADSGYSAQDVPLLVYPLENTATVKINVTSNIRNSGFWTLLMPQSVTVYDWTDTATSKMNQLAVRADIYSKISAVETLLWNYTKWRGKYIVADGNSLVESSNWIATTCSFLGANAVNVGKSGGAITAPNQPSATATIAEKQAYIVNNIDTNYPAKADLILLQDSSFLDGNYSDQMDGENPTDTWCARMNYFIRCLKTKYPNVLIVLMPDPTWYKQGYGGGGNDSTTGTDIVDEIFNTRNRMALEKMRGLAEYNRLAFFDIDHSTPFNPLMKANYYSQYYWLHEQYPTTKQDGVHPYRPYNTAKGYALAHFIAGLIFNPDAPNDAQEGWTDMIYTINSDGSATYPDVD